MLTFLGGERDGQDYYEIIPLSIIVTQDLVVTVRIQNTVYFTPYANSPSSANQTTASEFPGGTWKTAPESKDWLCMELSGSMVAGEAMESLRQVARTLAPDLS